MCVKTWRVGGVRGVCLWGRLGVGGCFFIPLFSIILCLSYHAILKNVFFFVFFLCKGSEKISLIARITA